MTDKHTRKNIKLIFKLNILFELKLLPNAQSVSKFKMLRF